MESQWLNVKSHDNGLAGVEFNGPHDSQLVNLVTYNNTYQGLWCRQGCQLTSAHSWGNSQTVAIQLDNTCYLTNVEAEGAANAQVLVRANDCSFVGGTVFAAGAITPIGFQVGDGTHPVAGLYVRTKVENCISSAILLSNDNGLSDIDVLVYQSGGTLISGTQNAESRVKTRTGGNYAAQGSNPSVPSSGSPWVNTTGADVMVNIWGGSLTAIAIDGRVSNAGSGSFYVAAGKSITLTYGSIPSWTVWGI
jgi:hypothetical protein